MTIELIIKILSMGMIASFITGIFLLIISIKNNKQIMQIEEKKERFQMDEKRYALLDEYLSEFEKIKFLHEKDDIVPEEDYKFLKDFFVDAINVFENMKKMHDRKSYLLDDVTFLTFTINQIDDLISKYIKKYKNNKEDNFDFDSMVMEMDKICMDIYELHNNYKSEIGHNMEKILRRL